MMLQPYEGHGSRSEELHRHVLRSHLAYLNQEETPAKLEQRHNLESLISEFLSIVSHSVKFTFLDVADIFNSSIENNPNFSAYKACSAFEALEKYALNLISQPWRKEFKTIKLYSGFYKHSVESQLIGSRATFHLLGYQYSDEGELYLDGPIDPDKVARVALDCLIAYVECQIMVQICERVKSYKCSWDEIHNIRQDYICSIDEAVRILHQLKRNASEDDKHDRWLRNKENGYLKEDKLMNKYEMAPNYSHKTGALIDVSNSWSNNFDSFSSYNNHPSLIHLNNPSGMHNKLNKESMLPSSKLGSWNEGILPLNENYQDANYITRTHDNYPTHTSDHLDANYIFFNRINNSGILPDSDSGSWNNSWDIIHSPIGSPCQNCYLNCDQDCHKINNSVPIMKEAHESHLNHIFPSHNITPSINPYFPHNYATSLRKCSCHMCCDQSLSSTTKKHNPTKISSNTLSHNPTFNRDTIPSNPSDISSSFSKFSRDNDISASKIKSFPSTSMTEALPQNYIDSSIDSLRSKNKIHSGINKRESYYDNVPSTYEKDLKSSAFVGEDLDSKSACHSNGTFLANEPLNSKSLIKKSLLDDSANNSSMKSSNSQKKVSNSSIVSMSDHLPIASHSESKSLKSYLPLTSKDSKNIKKWSCTACTYYNVGDKNICDMCGRSKHPGPEVTPLVSGGRECPQCTLVNKKESQDCSACGGSLKDSPTYI